MRLFLIYVVTISVVASLAQGVAEALWGTAVGKIIAVASIYLVTVVDLRIASPKWSIFRRILPNVSLLDLAIYFIPFAFMVAFLAGWMPALEQPLVGIIIALPLLFIWGAYLLLRLPHMRRGSADDLSWLRCPNMKLQERFLRYVGVTSRKA